SWSAQSTSRKAILEALIFTLCQRTVRSALYQKAADVSQAAFCLWCAAARAAPMPDKMAVVLSIHLTYTLKERT
ncbi:MAG: hypothetical protein V4578_17160, partial [Pseudomonadota bacterium]